jgi:hypothetical protein
LTEAEAAASEHHLGSGAEQVIRSRSVFTSSAVPLTTRIPSVPIPMPRAIAAGTSVGADPLRDLRHPFGAAASTTQTGLRANVMTWPDRVVNVVPPSASRS